MFSAIWTICSVIALGMYCGSRNDDKIKNKTPSEKFWVGVLATVLGPFTLGLALADLLENTKSKSKESL